MPSNVPCQSPADEIIMETLQGAESEKGLSWVWELYRDDNSSWKLQDHSTDLCTVG